jgi:hypothetical protein
MLRFILSVPDASGRSTATHTKQTEVTISNRVFILNLVKVRKYFPFVAIIFALAGIIFTYEWMFQGHPHEDLNPFNQKRDDPAFFESLVDSPKLITWLIFLVIKSTSYFVLFPYLLSKLFNSKKFILKKRDYIIFTVAVISLLECTTIYGSTMFEFLRNKGFLEPLESFVKRQGVISLLWGVISALLFALIFQYPFALNREMEDYKTKLLNAKDETEKMMITQQKIESISSLKSAMDSYFYLLGFIIALSELSFAALREAAIVGHTASFFPVEVVYYHGLFQSLLIAIVYVPFSYYFKMIAQTIEYKTDDEYYKELQLVTDLKLNLGAFKKIIPVISPLLGAAVPVLFNNIFS